MKRNIELVYKGTIFSIPNNWESVPSDVYLKLAENLMKMADGRLSVGEVRIFFVCDMMKWQIHKFRDIDSLANLICISEQLTFLFLINYPDNNAALDALEPEERELCRRTDPFLLHSPVAEELKKLDYKYVLDLCFCAQLLPSLYINDKQYQGYRVDVRYRVLTCSLTALQYIEARELIPQPEDTLPLLAAILYYPGDYDSEGAHALAATFSSLPVATLQAVSWNFQAFNNYLFSKTSFSLLTQIKPRHDRPITTDASDALYDLSADGLGDVSKIERMNILTYLRILRKKTIDGVRAMHGMDIDMLKISNETGLPISIIEQII